MRSYEYLVLLVILDLLRGGLGLQNVAHRKPATQSGSNSGTSTADKAVNGNSNSDISLGNCAHPDTTSTSASPEDLGGPAWWRVDLEREYDVYEVVIHNRNNYQNRLENTYVFVSNELRPSANLLTICNVITNGNLDVVPVVCDYGNSGPPKRGRYVMLQRKSYAYERHLMNFCEVEVHSCLQSYWGINVNGHNCTRECRYCADGTTCSVSDGHCYQCPSRRYDNDCSQTCNSNCAGSTCGISDGQCEQCVFGKYGFDCSQSCYCANNEQCSSDGQCQACPAGRFGHDCSQLCSYCAPGNHCGRQNGDCSQCLNGWYGVKCDQTCNCDACDIFTGNCGHYNCHPGFTKRGGICERDPETTTTTTTTTETPSAASSPENKKDGGGGGGAGLIGGVVGAFIVLLVLLIVAAVLLIRYKKLKRPGSAKKREVLLMPGSGKFISGGAFDNPALEAGDSKTSAANGIQTAVPETDSVDLDDDGEIYANPMVIPPIKVPDLSTYIERQKKEIDGFKKEYQLPTGDKAKWEVGNKVENRNKNRFVNIRAYDHSRVVLQLEDGDIHSDYINADFITGYKDVPKVYVAAQGPKKCTIVDTWRMLWELNANRMIMVTNLVESGKIKCEQYWPDTEDQYGKFKVALGETEQYADYTIKKFTVTREGETRTVHHFHFTSWPDHGVPITATALLNFRRKIRAYDESATGPMVVHCSAGVGRTGTFIALDYLLQQAREEGEVDIYGYTCIMRSNRVNMIQTLEQYIFVYDGLLEALMSGDTSIQCPQLQEEFEKLQKVDPKTKKTKLQEQFEVLQVLKPAKREEKLTALEPQNVDKNRDREIVPSNRFRPFLSIQIDGCTDYINAAYVDGYKARLAYILTQSPLPNTIIDIWRMAYDHASRTIVMLNQLSEDDKDCPMYWPNNEDSPLEFGPLKVSLTEERQDSVTPSVIVRDFSVVHSNKPNNAVTVKQFHLTNWPEGQELPESKKDLLDVMDLVERWQQQSGNGPVTIHCRDGSEKSGLYCGAAYMVEKLKLDREVDAFHAVKHVRVVRPSNIPSIEQYKYLHELALEYMDKYEIYANFK